MKLLSIVIFLFSVQAKANLGFYCKNALSLALKGYSYKKDYESSLKKVETRLNTIKSLTHKMIKSKKSDPKDRKQVLTSFAGLNKHYLKHKKTITQISDTTSCGQDLVKQMNGLQGVMKKPMNSNDIKNLNKLSNNVINTLNSIK